jgi:glycosyltransferase involved in cell wall biosynthesis
MRVVHIINCLPLIGGAERLVLDLAKASAQRPVPVITWWNADNSLVELDSTHALDVISLRPLSLSALKRARRVLSAADVVHIHLFPSLYLAPLLSKPTVYTEHNTWNRRRDRWWLQPIERWCYRRLSKVVSISEMTGRALVKWLGESPPALETIPNGVDLGRFPLRARKVRRGVDMVIGMAGRFAQEKDHETLLNAFASLPATFRLKLAGDGPLLREFQEKARALGVASRVEFLGVVSDITAFYRELDLYVQSSRYDGFSLVAVEAMASGLPVIASDIDGLRDTIGRSDLLFEAGNPESLASRVLQIYHDPERYDRLSEYAAKRAITFDILETARRYEAAYRNAMLAYRNAVLA